MQILIRLRNNHFARIHIPSRERIGRPFVNFWPVRKDNLQECAHYIRHISLSPCLGVEAFIAVWKKARNSKPIFMKCYCGILHYIVLTFYILVTRIRILDAFLRWCVNFYSLTSSVYQYEECMCLTNLAFVYSVQSRFSFTNPLNRTITCALFPYNITVLDCSWHSPPTTNEAKNACWLVAYASSLP
jgi:hypothetical protein